LGEKRVGVREKEESVSDKGGKTKDKGEIEVKRVK
jgi:hypothetical protein